MNSEAIDQQFHRQRALDTHGHVGGRRCFQGWRHLVGRKQRHAGRSESVADTVGIGHNGGPGAIIDDRQLDGAADADMLRWHRPFAQRLGKGERAIDPDLVRSMNGDVRAKKYIPRILQRRLNLALAAVNDDSDRAQRPDLNDHASNERFALPMRQGSVLPGFQPQLAEQFADRSAARPQRLQGAAMVYAQLDHAELSIA